MRKHMLTTLLIILALILLGCTGTPPAPSFDVDIKPESCPNPLNMKSKGVLPVAVLGTEDFDVSTDIDPAEVTLMGVPPITWHYEDVSTWLEDRSECECTDAGPDGYLDLVFQFDTPAIAAMLEELAAFYGGTIEDGVEGPLLLFEGDVPDPEDDPVWSGDEVLGYDCVVIRKKGRN
jgi:hypothetical protein